MIAAVVRRAEGCFGQQTQVAGGLERLERARSVAPPIPPKWRVTQTHFEDLRMGIEGWRREMLEVMDQAAAAIAGRRPDAVLPPAKPGKPSWSVLPGGQRLQNWEEWVQESVDLLGASLAAAVEGGPGSSERTTADLEKVAAQVAGSSREVSALSREVAQMQVAWDRLGERLKTLMVRAGETLHDPRLAARELENGEQEEGAEGD